MLLAWLCMGGCSVSLLSSLMSSVCFMRYRSGPTWAVSACALVVAALCSLSGGGILIVWLRLCLRRLVVRVVSPPRALGDLVSAALICVCVRSVVLTACVCVQPLLGLNAAGVLARAVAAVSECRGAFFELCGARQLTHCVCTQPLRARTSHCRRLGRVRVSAIVSAERSLFSRWLLLMPCALRALDAEAWGACCWPL